MNKLGLSVVEGAPLPQPAARSTPHAERDGQKWEEKVGKPPSRAKSSSSCQNRDAHVSVSTGANRF